MENKKIIEWCSDQHLELANIYMDAEDNISCYDGCKEMSMDHLNNNYKDAIKTIKKNREKNKNQKITIIWGTDQEKTQTYTFENKEQAKFFMDGVDESNGWLEYEVKKGWFDK